MKFLYILPALLFLCACDNNNFNGICLRNARNVTTTEQNGYITSKEATDLFVCGCFNDIKLDEPKFMISKDEFTFEIKYSMEPTDVYTIKEQSAICDKECTKLCNK